MAKAAVHYRHDQAAVDRMRRLYETHGSYEAVAAIMRIAKATVSKYRHLGWVAKSLDGRCKAVPSDFIIQAPRLSVKQLRQHYDVCQCTVYRWLAETGIQRNYMPPPQNRLLPVPADVPEVVARLGLKGAQRHYRIGHQTLVRWRRAHGMPIGHSRQKKAVSAPQRSWMEEYLDQQRRQAAEQRLKLAA